MTTQANIPNKWYVPFANGDASRVELPVTTADPTRASQTLGFPPLTMQPPESGGVPPQGEDFNGGMNQIARVAWWVLNGGGWPYDSTFANNANINGYPNGATLQAADFRGDWISTADGNTNNPDTNGTNWVPGFQYGVTALSSLIGGTVTPTPAQAAKGTITLAGTLTSALTVILPTWLKNWTITNNTTGAYVAIVKTAAGSGVTIPQNGAPTRVSGDGTNITQAAENIGAGTTGTQAAQLQQQPNRNFVTNPNFAINERNYASGTVIGSGSFAIDSWKAVVASSSMTFTAAPQGQTVTIAGQFRQTLLQQDILAGTYTVSWTGTAQGRLYNVGGSAPSYVSSPFTTTLDGLANVALEFNAGTLGKVKVESGTVATPYIQRPLAEELTLQHFRSERIFFPANTVFSVGQAVSATSAFGVMRYARKLQVPSVTYTGTAIVWQAGATSGGGTVTLTTPAQDACVVTVASASGLVAGNAASFVSTGGTLSAFIDADL